MWVHHNGFNQNESVVYMLLQTQTRDKIKWWIFNFLSETLLELRNERTENSKPSIQTVKIILIYQTCQQPVEYSAGFPYD